MYKYIIYYRLFINSRRPENRFDVLKIIVMKLLRRIYYCTNILTDTKIAAVIFTLTDHNNISIYVSY